MTLLLFLTFRALQEIEFFTSSIGQLKVAQTKYVDAKDSLNVLNENNKGEQAFYFLSHQINKVIGENCIYITNRIPFVLNLVY